jgi:hypothetical protein
MCGAHLRQKVRGKSIPKAYRDAEKLVETLPDFLMATN